MSERLNSTADILIAGGGLAGGLIALALSARHPELDVRIVEPGAVIGGNHIWSFFDSDIDPAHRWLIDPLICQSWEGHDVRFPAHKRTLGGTYNSILSQRLDNLVREALPPERIIRATAAAITPDSVTLESGQQIIARAVIDARGAPDFSAFDLGWQKFLGQLLQIEGGHGLTRPVVMDATVPQIDGYRFVYCLPFDADHVFVEDTYYSDTPGLNPDALRGRIMDYAARQGWVITYIGHEEAGCLPVALDGDFKTFQKQGPRIAAAGMRAGLFHPLTGYALPDAVRMAASIADLDDLNPIALASLSSGMAKNAWAGRRFYRWLTRMLFRAADPPLRYRVLEQFYRRDEALVARFYAGRSTLADKMRILSGKPPVPITRAIKALLGKP